MIDFAWKINEIMNMPIVNTIFYLICIVIVIVSIFSVVFMDNNK